MRSILINCRLGNQAIIQNGQENKAKTRAMQDHYPPLKRGEKNTIEEEYEDCLKNHVCP